MLRRTLIDFYADLSSTPGEFVVYDDGYRSWSYTYAEVTAAALKDGRQISRAHTVLDHGAMDGVGADRYLVCARRWTGADLDPEVIGERGPVCRGPGAGSTLRLAADGRRMFRLVQPDLPAARKGDMGQTSPAFFRHRPALHVFSL